MTIINLDERRASRRHVIEKSLIKLSDIEPTLRLNHMVKGWLGKGALSMLYGPSNAGKTFVALDIAMHVASNRIWRGCKVNGGPVLYVAAEGGAGVKNRLSAFKNEYPEMQDAPFSLLPIPLDLHGSDDAKAVCDALPDERPVLIVIDTLARSMGVGDENTAKDAAMFVSNCDLIRQVSNAHVMIIHHSGKDSDKGARGSSALRAAVDTELHVTGNGEIVCRKQRDMAITETLHFELRSVPLGHDEDGEAVTSAVVTEASAPSPQRKPLTGKNEVAIQALRESIRIHGTAKTGDAWPANRKVVSVSHWRDACSEHGLTSGSSDSAVRTAFMRAKEKLMDLDEIREFGGYVWRVQEDE